MSITDADREAFGRMAMSALDQIEAHARSAGANDINLRGAVLIYEVEYSNTDTEWFETDTFAADGTTAAHAAGLCSTAHANLTSPITLNATDEDPE